MYKEIDCTNSKAIERLVYDDVTKDLYVLYRNRKQSDNVFIYKNIEQKTINLLKQSSSIGQFVSYIRNMAPFTRTGEFPLTNPKDSAFNSQNLKSNKNSSRKRLNRQDFTDLWINAIHDAGIDIERLNELIRILSKLPKTRPPYKIPPAHNFNNNTNYTENFAKFQNQQFVNMFDDGNSDDLDDEIQSVEIAEINVTRNNSGLSLQCRYLLLICKCSIGECIRSKGIYFFNDGQYKESAKCWIEAYEFINNLFIDIDEWYAILLDSESYDNQVELPKYHVRDQLKYVFEGIRILQEDTEENKLRAIDDCDRRLKQIDAKLYPQLMDRNAARDRLGIHFWNNNPNPKYDYAERRKKMEEDQRNLTALMQSLKSLHFSNNLNSR